MMQSRTTLTINWPKNLGLVNQVVEMWGESGQKLDEIEASRHI